MRRVSKYWIKLMLICGAFLSLSACIVETTSPLYLPNEAVSPLANSNLLVISNGAGQEYIHATKQDNNKYFVTLPPSEPQLTAAFYPFPNKDNHYIIQVEISNEVGKFSYFFAILNGDKLTVGAGNKITPPHISTPQQMFGYFTQILADDEIDTHQFTLYNLDDEQQAAKAASIIKQIDKDRKTRAAQQGSTTVNQ